MRWFGKAYGAPYESDTPKCEAPQDSPPCGHCREPVLPSEDGVLIPVFCIESSEDLPLHYECHLRRIVGGLNHILGCCICCGGTERPDPPELSRRDAAHAAVQAWRQRNR